jgi:hypothetical protein
MNPIKHLILNNVPDASEDILHQQRITNQLLRQSLQLLPGCPWIP